MDQASASPAASYARNPAALRTSSSCSQSADRAQTAAPPLARSSPQSEPHSEPVRIAPRPSSPALCQSNAKGYLLPDFYSGCATGKSGRFTEGLLPRRSQFGAAVRGWLFTETGKASDAVAAITSGIASLRSSGAILYEPWHLWYLAIAYADLRQPDDARRCIEDAINKVERSKEKWCEAEV